MIDIEKMKAVALGLAFGYYIPSQKDFSFHSGEGPHSTIQEAGDKTMMFEFHISTLILIGLVCFLAGIVAGVGK